jgi:hypothetical protein
MKRVVSQVGAYEGLPGGLVQGFMSKVMRGVGEGVSSTCAAHYHGYDV